MPILRFLLLIAGVGLSLGLTAQPYGFLSWSVADGLPHSQASALAEDARGFLWVGTRGGGVARFDGQEFRTFNTADGLPDNYVAALSATPDGSVFVRTRRGAAVLLAGAERWEPAPFPADTAKSYSRGAPAAEIPEVTERIALRSGNTLVASATAGLYVLAADGSVLHYYTSANSDLPDNRVLALLRDRQERFWVGTAGGGIARMIPTGLRLFDARDGLDGKRITALHFDSKGRRLWVATARRGMQYLDSAGFSRPAVDDPTRGALTTSITQDASGRTYFATAGRGIAVIDDSLRVERLTQRSGLPSNRILALFPAVADSAVWALPYLAPPALIRWRDSVFRVTSLQPGDWPPDVRLTAATRTGAGELLLATTAGKVLRWSPGNSTVVYDAENGLPEAAAIRAIATRRGSQLWVAVAGYGLYYTDIRAEQPVFAPLPPRLRRESFTNIFQLTAPPDRPEIWVGTDRGVDRIFLDDQGQPDWLRHYGRAEGFLGGEATEASLTDPTGDTWFGTTDGLVRFAGDDPNDFLAAPATHLTAISVFYTPVDSVAHTLNKAVPTFRAQDNHFNFQYRAVDLTYPDRIRYRYRLRGEDRDWSPPTAETSVRYAGLGAGGYLFRVQASTDGGKTWGAAATYGFSISRPLVRQPWFLGVLALAGAAGLIGIFYFFYRRVKRREAARRRALETRNELLELEQKALRLQMNPHFIFNALNGIRGLVDGEHTAEARQQISRFAVLMRGILDNSRRDKISLAAEIKTLDDYLRMEQFCQPFPFTYAIHPPENIDPDEISLPPMLVQPFVENAVLHGLSGREAGGHVAVRFRVRGRRMQCSVTDNGIGRAAAASRRKDRSPGHKSVALDVTRARLAALKGGFQIEDLAIGGTKVTLTLPVESW